jgi:hypothetical protein
MPQTQIIREQIIVVDHSETDQYGNLIVTDKRGDKYKIGAKRSALFGVIVPGRAVKLGYGTYMNKDYIADAVLVETPPAQPTPTSYPKPPQESVQSKSSPVPAQTKGIIPESRNKSFAIAYAKDVMVAKITVGLIKEINKVEVDKCIKLAEEFRAYMDGDNHLVEAVKKMGGQVEEDENPQG